MESQKRLPTEKQVKLANWICNVLGKQLPTNNTIDSYREFISANIDEFNQKKCYIKKKRRRYRRYNKRNYYTQYKKSNHYTYENTYGGAHDSDIIDCYDFGISPWGDS